MAGGKKNILQKVRSFAEQVAEKPGETSHPPVFGSATSDTSVVEEVRQVIRAKVTKNLKNLGIGPSLHD